MMQAHIEAYGMAKAFSFAAGKPPGEDLLAQAFRAGQEVYKAGLIAHVNARRQALKKPPLGWPEVGGTPHEVVMREGPARLIRYDAGAPKGDPILLVCSLINRPYVLDLLPERSVVRRLLDTGREVYLLDWGTPGPEESKNGLDYYALDLLPRAARKVAARPHVLGYCMGGTFALIAMGQGALDVTSLVAMATPVDFDDPGLLSLWCRAPDFDPEAIVRAYGNAPPHLLQPAFKLLDPVGLSTKLAHLDEKVGDDDFVRFFLAMETWLEDSVAFPGRAYVDWLRLYRENSLARKGSLKTLTAPILSLVAEQDYVTPPQSSLAIERLAPRAKHQIERQAGGHIGLATSSAAHRTLWPKVSAWLSANERANAGVSVSAKPSAKVNANAKVNAKTNAKVNGRKRKGRRA